MLDIPFQSASALASLIRRRKIGCAELLELYLARVEKYNPALNAIIATDLEGARKRARAADRTLARKKPWGPLHGVPMTIKESYDVVGMPTTWGVPELKDNFPTRNALAVDRLLAAGVVLFGKTNVPLYLADYQSYNAIYGTTNNPWDLSRAPGGSSGGSAAALAAGLTGFEAGSDIGSSIRNPAHYCGVFGHKPTWGIVPPRGQTLGRMSQSDISVIGPLARSADDLETGLQVMAGPDEIDGAGYRLTLAKPRQKAVRDYKVAVMLTDAVSEVDAEVQARVEAVADFLAKKRARVSDRARPDVDTAEAQRGMLRANMLTHRDWLAASEARHQMRWKWAEFFREYDLLLCPAAASAAFPHDQKGERYQRTIEVNGRRVPTTDQLFWAGYSGMVYLPSTVAPAGFTKSGLPVGVQIIGPQYGDLTCIHMARLLEREFQAFVPPPNYA